MIGDIGELQWVVGNNCGMWWGGGGWGFFFQAEDGIRDVRTWLEFRRVLFRSAALGKEHIYDANAKYRNEGRREKWVRSFTTDCLTTRDNDTNQNISASIQSANRHDEETRIYHFAAHQICSKHLFCHIPFCYLLLVRFIRLYTFSEMYFLYRHHSWIMPLMDSSSLSW